MCGFLRVSGGWRSSKDTTKEVLIILSKIFASNAFLKGKKRHMQNVIRILTDQLLCRSIQFCSPAVKRTLKFPLTPFPAKGHQHYEVVTIQIIPLSFQTEGATDCNNLCGAVVQVSSSTSWNGGRIEMTPPSLPAILVSCLVSFL